MKKNLYALGVLLLASILVVPAYANVNVNVDTIEDVNIVVYSDGSVSIVCNGVDVLSHISSLSAWLNHLHNSIDDLQVENQQLKADLVALVSELEGILDSLYARTAFLAGVIGVTANDTATQRFLDSNETVIGNLASAWASLGSLESDIAELTDLVNIQDAKLTNIEALKNVTDSQHAVLGEHDSALLQLQQNQNFLNGKLESLEAELVVLRRENSDADSRTAQLSWISFGAIGVAAVSLLALLGRRKPKAETTEKTDYRLE